MLTCYFVSDAFKSQWGASSFHAMPCYLAGQKQVLGLAGWCTGEGCLLFGASAVCAVIDLVYRFETFFPWFLWQRY